MRLFNIASAVCLTASLSLHRLLPGAAAQHLKATVRDGILEERAEMERERELFGGSPYDLCMSHDCCIDDIYDPYFCSYVGKCGKRPCKKTDHPTDSPTEPPTESPTEPPTKSPSEPPTKSPSEPPTESPSESPSEPPSESPSEPPSESPSESPSEPPTKSPTESPTEPPTSPPTEQPTVAPVVLCPDVAPKHLDYCSPAQKNAYCPYECCCKDDYYYHHDLDCVANKYVCYCGMNHRWECSRVEDAPVCSGSKYGRCGLCQPREHFSEEELYYWEEGEELKGEEEKEKKKKKSKKKKKTREGGVGPDGTTIDANEEETGSGGVEPDESTIDAYAEDNGFDGEGQ